jgi:D-serine deaminase-like pyridoxal phosphate-dependent protein
MDAVLPGTKLRPHVKAFKCTSLARRLSADGHKGFCAATPREIEGLVAAGLGDDVLLANESLDVARLGAHSDSAQITVAVDSAETLAAAVAGGIRSVLLDINVGLPRCGCDPETAARLAESARASGLDVRGVMGYEGHLVMTIDRAERLEKVEASMSVLLAAHELIGGDIISGGATGTFDTNTWCNEIQAGSYTLMDTDYDRLDLPFRKALRVVATVVSVNSSGWIVADAGLKAFGMDHGKPVWDEGKVWICSDEHVTLGPSEGRNWKVGDRVSLWPSHVDPTVARHTQIYLVDDNEAIIDVWPVDLRHW